MNHVEALVKMAAQHGVKTVRVHASWMAATSTRSPVPAT